MFKNMKKKLMVIISAILVFTMIPSVALADEEETTYESVSEFFASLPEGENELTVSPFYYNKDGEEKTNKMLGNVSATLTVNEDGTNDLTISCASKSSLEYAFSEMTIADTSYDYVKPAATVTNEEDGKSVERTIYSYVIEDVDADLFTATSDFEGYTYKLAFDSFSATKGEKTTDILYVLFDFPVVEPTEPAPVEPDPVDPAPVDPAPVDPAPVDPAPADPSSNEEDSDAIIGVTITRFGNFSVESTGSEYNRGYRVVDYNAETGIATVELTGEFTKQFMGSYSDAENASDSQLTSLTPVDGKTTIMVAVSALDEPIHVSLKQVAMGGKWREYTLEFYAKAAKPVDVEETETALVVDAEDETEVAINVEQLVDATKPLEIKTQVGTVTFDTNALAGFANVDTKNINFEMRDLKEDPKYQNTKFDMILELNLTDDYGNPIFTEGQGGKATITVPYDKEVPDGMKVVVYYIGLNGREEVEATYDATTKTVTFTVEHFSTYAIIQEAVVDKTANDSASSNAAPATGDNSMTIVIVCVVIAAVAVAGITAAVVIKKKSANSDK